MKKCATSLAEAEAQEHAAEAEAEGGDEDDDNNGAAASAAAHTRARENARARRAGWYGRAGPDLALLDATTWPEVRGIRMRPRAACIADPSSARRVTNTL